MRSGLFAILFVIAAATLPAQEQPPAEPAPDPPATETEREEIDPDPDVEDLFGDPLFDDPVEGDSGGTGDGSFFDDPFATVEPLDQYNGAGEAFPGNETTDPLTDDVFALDDLDSLFITDEEIIEESSPADVSSDPSSDLLTSEGVTWGGRISGSAAADLTWDDVWTADFGLFDPTGQSLSPSIGADLFFDARPESEFRAFGKLRIDTTDTGDLDFAGLAVDAGDIDETDLPEGWTSEENEDGDTEIRDAGGTLIITIPGDDEETSDDEEEDTGALGTAPGLEIAVIELFTDFTWKEALFFRFGKHTIRWGTGYFFSPADVLNLTAVDAEDPTAEREGPISLRAQYPFGITGNLYLYTIINDGAAPRDVAIAPKVEFAVGSGELGIGAYYQRTLAPRAVVLYSATVGEVDLFGEMVGLYGSDRVFVRPSRDQSAAEEDPEDELVLVLDTFEQPDALFLQATGGLRYLKEFENAGSLALIGQYFFNGEGYDQSIAGLRPAAIRLQANPGENGLAIEDADAQPEGYEDPLALGFGDLTTWGRHSVGLTIAYSDIFNANVGVSAFLLLSMSDWSGIFTPAVNYNFLDRFSASVSARFTFGDEYDEYTDPAASLQGEVAKPTFGLTISVSMPGGVF